MASHLLKIQIKPIRFPHRSIPFSLSKSSHYLTFPSNYPFQSQHLSKFPPFCINSSLSSSPPPTTKEEAILQAKTSLSTTLQKPLNNPKLTGKIKKLKQARLRVEIPVMDDSPESIIQLAFDIFSDLPLKRKGPPVKTLLVWPNSISLTTGVRAFEKSVPSDVVKHIDLTTVMTVDNTRILNSADVVAFLAPEISQLAVMKALSDSLYPKPMVLFNPKWGFEEESEFGDLSSFVGSFDVIYAFQGLEVRGLLSKRKGVVFKYVRDGISSGERWDVLVEEEGGDLKVVTRFKSRPSITEVENVLYNVMAANSPITKSAKFLRDLVSNATGRK